MMTSPSPAGGLVYHCCLRRRVTALGLLLLHLLGFAALTSSAAPISMPLISRNVPAFASGSSPFISPAVANDANYQSMWVSDTLPAWIAYDLSGVPLGQRQQVLVSWHASWALGYINTNPAPDLRLPVDYTIEINPAAGGGAAPTSGWQTVVTVTGNNRGARQHLVALNGAAWIRLRATTGSSTENFAIDLDVHSAPDGASDCWLFMGDSITGFTAYLFSDLPGRVNALDATRWPVVVAASIGGSNEYSAADVIDESLATFPGRYVTLNYGTNGGGSGFYAAMEVLVQKVIAAGKIPVIPSMPWSDIPDQLAKAPAVNAQIDQLYAAYPVILRGPDLYTAFTGRTDWIPSGDVHPNDAGQQEMRRLWALVMAAAGNVPPVAVTPEAPILYTGAQRQFTATVTGLAGTGVTWSVLENGGGTINSAGLYTAPASVGTYHVKATSTVDGTKSATVVVTVQTDNRIPTGFDLAGYFARNADVAALYATNYYGAWQHFWNYGLAEGRQFDAQFIVDEYLALNADLQAAFGTDRQAALLHWFSYGRPVDDRLGRVPIGFNVDAYLGRYSDLNAAFGAITPTTRRNATVWQHYLDYGVREGRTDGDFEANNYLATNSDLAAAFGSDVEAAALHWFKHGRREGRRIPANFSVTGYRTRNPDVALFWGDDLYGCWLHYRDTGINEGRTFDDLFRVLEYRALNADVAAAYGSDLTATLLHWLYYGRAEGRLGRNP